MRQTALVMLAALALPAVCQDATDFDALVETLARYTVDPDSTVCAQIEGWIDGLGDPDFDTREESQSALAAFGLQAVPLLVTRRDEDPAPEISFRIESILSLFIDGIALESRTYRDGTPQREVLRFGGEKWGECNWHSNGALKDLKRYRAGVAHGTWQSWFPDGQLRERYHYIEGQRAGVSHSWWRNGQMAVECHYRADQLHGSFHSWREDGGLFQQGGFQHGLKDGRWEQWRDGERRVERWANGVQQPTE